MNRTCVFVYSRQFKSSSENAAKSNTNIFLPPIMQATLLYNSNLFNGNFIEYAFFEK